MARILKYDLPIERGEFTLPMPLSAQILWVNAQSETPRMWAQVDTEDGACPRKFFNYHTGDEVNPAHRYVGTVGLDENRYILHVYEI